MTNPSEKIERLPGFSPQPRRGMAAVFWVVAILGLVLLPFLFAAWPVEKARWMAAQAIELDLSGDAGNALSLMEQAIQTAPEEKSLNLRYAEMLQERGRASDAARVCQELMERQLAAGVSLETSFQRRLYACRIFSELQLGNSAVALDLTKKLEDSSPKPYQTREGLNLVAYVRALANTELNQARWCVQQVMKDFQGPPDAQLSQPLVLHFQGLTAAALLARRFDRQNLILPLFDEEVAAVQQEQAEAFESLLGRSYFALAQGTGEQPPKIPDEFEVRLEEAIARQNLACLYLARALLQDDLGKLPSAHSDRWAAQQLGANEEAWLSKLPTDLQAFSVVYEASAFLDTEACVQFRVAKNKQEIHRALRLLNFAIVADELCQLVWHSDLPNQMQLTADLRVLQRDARKSLAVKLRHRQDILKAIKQFELAAADADRIRSLGFQQEDMLF